MHTHFVDCCDCVVLASGKTSEIFGSEDKSLEATGVEVRSECSEVRGLLETIKGLSKVGMAPSLFV